MSPRAQPAQAPQEARSGAGSVAVVGSGVSGLTAAHLLSRRYDVVLFEAEPRLGGHAHTHDVRDAQGARHAVDSGFIVHNDVTYPRLRQLFAELDVQVRPTEMSMSIRCDGCGLEYAGGRGARGVLAQPGRVLDPRFARLLGQVRRFHRRAATFLRTRTDDLSTYGQWLTAEGFTGHFIAHYAVPLVSCVWSSGREVSLSYPARYLFEFLDHHGMLAVTGSPQWSTVVGGSRVYVERLAARLSDVRRSHAVTDVTRHADGVDLRDVSGRVTRVDRVVLATHADQALALLTDPSDAEVTTLKQFAYSRNETVLHTDASVLPRAPRARASWNYRMSGCSTRDEPPVVSYWMNRLQGLEAADQYLVTLNDPGLVDPGAVLARMTYEHPIYTPDTLRAQTRLPGLATGRTVYAGAYHGWGFHEDGCRSGVAAARHFGVDW
ncbi:MAG TPA: FAD-dependent oxidoreductase [Segeticoccus sp.]|uniref:NAD(P)/FAD-dependent oxidoreductase n=1 Tax=Segeticoccus sp. TaxID=2706531 RepID=UPI002D810CE1|nr:FAD-dependent oxidoreductase [Segeticoccus sp.]HET8601184.1 FAD-dependent oxidoreductase [Segeticoccus sp.]